MRIRYQSICQLQLQHGYFAGDRGSQGFRVHPTPSCQRILAEHNFVFRESDNGFSLYGEVDPLTDPAKLLHELGEETPKLTFWLEAINPLLLNISELPPHKPGREIFYFNNLSDQRVVPKAESPLFLGDSVNNLQLGDPVEFISGSIYTYQFAAPVTVATLVIKDLFDNTIHTVAVNESEPVSEYRLNLDEINKLKEGRYSIADSQGKSVSFYYDRGVRGRPLLGVVELYNTTVHITVDNSEKVPAAYRFLSSTNTLTNITPFTLKLNSRATTWRYIVTKKYTNNGIALNELSVLDTEGTVSFNPNPGDQHIIFTANTPLPLSETHKPIELHRSSNKFRELPTPTLTTALQKDPAGFSSDIYIYV